MAKVIECTCGTVITGADDKQLLDNARRHVRESHPIWPDLADDELLHMAVPAD